MASKKTSRVENSAPETAPVVTGATVSSPTKGKGKGAPVSSPTKGKGKGAPEANPKGKGKATPETPPTKSESGSRREAILKALRGTSVSSPLTRAEIAEKTGSDSKTGSTCRGLEEEGLIGVTPIEGNGRVLGYFLTAKGAKAI